MKIYANKIKIILIALLFSFIAGCEADDISYVKSGILDFNKTITVGQAFDNWNACGSTIWSKFKTDNGTRVVEFTCAFANVKEYLSRIKSFKDKPKQKKDDDTDVLDIVAIKQIFQFTINQDDTFQVDNIQRYITWTDGYTVKQSQDIDETVETAYNDEGRWNLDELQDISQQQKRNLITVMEQFFLKPYLIAYRQKHLDKNVGKQSESK